MTEPVLHYDESLGQNTRSGTWEQLAVGTYQVIQETLDAGDGAAAADLISVTYCVHCCLLNMVMPIDRLGYPTRVIDPPTWPAARSGAPCTWWVYKDPARVPDEVYQRVGRRRNQAQKGTAP